jgi:hypothetical protein
MTKFLIGFLTLFLVVNGQTAFAKPKAKYRAFKPSMAGESVFLKSGTKRYKYYVLEKEKAIYFEINGPTKIKIRTRADLGNLESAEYDLYVWESKEVIAGRKAKTEPSKLQVEGRSGKCGVARDLFFDVPSGKHTFTISFRSEKVDWVNLRFYQKRPPKKKAKYMSFLPYEYSRAINLKTSKSEISYYLVKEDGGVSVKVIGPTKLQIFCRANYDPSMKGKSKFALGVYEKGKSVETFKGIARKSGKMVFSDLPELIPSTAHKFYLDVPKGEHIYELKKVNSPAPSLAVRLRIQEDALGKKK